MQRLLTHTVLTAIALTQAQFSMCNSGSYFTLSLFDKMWHPNLTQDEAVVMLEKGIEEVRKRLVVAPPHYLIKVIDKDGIREVKKV